MSDNLMQHEAAVSVKRAYCRSYVIYSLNQRQKPYFQVFCIWIYEFAILIYENYRNSLEPQDEH